jgi:hypothetical protein
MNQFKESSFDLPWLITSDEQHSGVHDGGTVQHCGHQNVVTRTGRKQQNNDKKLG